MGTYPKKIPPKEAKTHSKYALNVTGASTLSGLVVPVTPGTFTVDVRAVLELISFRILTRCLLVCSMKGKETRYNK
jgi:hypothetical protein